MKVRTIQAIRFATTNRHKFEEVREMCAARGVRVEHVDMDYEEPRAQTCTEVARRAVQEVAKKVEPPVIIEDSGLFIDALNGFPGAYSAYAYKTVGLEGILRLMEGRENRSARFVSAIGYHDGNEARVFEGKVEGEIAERLRGNEGFGYDPLFIPKGYKFTFAENMTLKRRLSHRAAAVERFIRHLLGDG